MPAHVASPQRNASVVEYWRNATMLSATQMARGVLIATGLVICLAIGVWMLLLISGKRHPINVWAFPIAPDVVLPWFGSPTSDAGEVAGQTGGKANELQPDKFLDQYERLLNKPSTGGSVILYVSAAGLADQENSFLLVRRAEQVNAKLKEMLPDSSFSPAALIETSRRNPEKQILLLWDAGQIGSDRGLGVYGNQFLQQFVDAFKADAENHPGQPTANLVILFSCAPGQTSWWSDHDGRSVFGHFIASGLRGAAKGYDPADPGLTVQALVNYVRSQVSSWVKDHRGAEQTPIFLSARPLAEVKFRLPPLGQPRTVTAVFRRTDRAATAGADGKGKEDTEEKEKTEDDPTERLLKRFAEKWTKFEAMSRTNLLHRAPVRWLTYRDHLLYAERRFRAGDLGLAEELLNSLRDMDNEDPDVPISLAELRLQDEAGSPAVQAAEQALDDAIAELLLGERAEPSSNKVGDQAAKEDVAVRGDEQPSPTKGKQPPRENAPNPDSKVPGEAERPTAPEAGDALKAKQLPKISGLQVGEQKSRLTANEIFAKLASDGAENVPRYLEYQLPMWARKFTHTRMDPIGGYGPDPQAFNGRRGDLLRKAIEVRRRGEEAAALDTRILPCVEPLMEHGDRLRRIAQDRLFTADDAKRSTVGDLLSRGLAHYDRAARVAKVASEAIQLVDQVVADAPGYAQWRLRRPSQSKADPERPVLDMLEQARVLVQRISHNSDARVQRSDADAPETDLKPIEIELNIEHIESATAELRKSHEGLEREFEDTRKNDRTWVQLDALLANATIPANARLDILRRIGNAKVAGTLPKEDENIPSRADRASSTGSTTPGVDQEGAHDDPGSRKLAAGLARLDLALLAMCAEEQQLRGIDKVRELCDQPKEVKRAEWMKTMATISHDIRALRAERLKNLKDRVNVTPSGLMARDLAIRVLPRADIEGLSGGEFDPSRYFRKARLIWHAKRLLEDFAPLPARRVLERAQRAGIPNPDLDEEIRKGLSEAKRLADIAPLLETPPKGIQLGDKDSLPTSLSLTRAGDLPAGEASFFIAQEPTAPVDVVSKTDNVKLSTGCLVRVGAEKSSSPIELVVSRTEPTRGNREFPLRPGAFYRGQIIPREGTKLILSMLPKGKIEVELRQSDPTMVREHGDQFRRHRNQGFLHPGPRPRLACKIVISHDFTTKTVVRVKHGFPDSTDERTVSLLPGQDNSELTFLVDPGRDHVTDDRTREYLVEIYPEKETKAKDPKAPPLYKNQFPFRVLKTEEIVAIEFAGFVAEEGRVYVLVRHLASDPVSGPVEYVTVTIGGNMPGTQRLMRRGQTQDWYVTYGNDPPEKIPVIVQINNLPNATIKREILTGPDASPGGAGAGAPGGAGGAPKPPNL